MTLRTRSFRQQLGMMTPPFPYLNPFDWKVFRKVVDPSQVLYSGPFLCRWCARPVDYVDSMLDFTTNALYHLLPEDEEPCAFLRKLVVKGARV